MSESIWETFDALFKTVREQEKRANELERRVATLETQLSEARYRMGLTPVDEVYEAALADVYESERWASKFGLPS